MTIKQTIETLFEANDSNCYESILHFYKRDKNDVLRSITIRESLSKKYPITLIIDEFDSLLKNEIRKLLKIPLKYSESEHFFSKKGKYYMNFERNIEYSEEIIIKIYREVWKENDLSDLKYDILPW